MGFELPYLPPGYSPQQVQQAGYQYAQSHGYRGPHMVMQEGSITYQNGVPGIMVKYVDGQGLSTTEWTPLPSSAPPPQQPHVIQRQPVPQHPQMGPAQQDQPSSVASALTVPQQHAPDAQNPKAIAYAKHRLEQLAALGIQYQQYGDPTETWRHASETIADAAHSRGYDNPRDFLEGRPPNHPAPGLGGHPAPPQAPQPVGAPDQQFPTPPRGPVDRAHAQGNHRHPRTDVVFSGGIPGFPGGDEKHLAGIDALRGPRRPQHPDTGAIRAALAGRRGAPPIVRMSGPPRRSRGVR